MIDMIDRQTDRSGPYSQKEPLLQSYLRMFYAALFLPVSKKWNQLEYSVLNVMSLSNPPPKAQGSTQKRSQKIVKAGGGRSL